MSSYIILICYLAFSAAHAFIMKGSESPFLYLAKNCISRCAIWVESFETADQRSRSFRLRMAQATGRPVVVRVFGVADLIVTRPCPVPSWFSLRL